MKDKHTIACHLSRIKEVIFLKLLKFFLRGRPLVANIDLQFKTAKNIEGVYFMISQKFTAVECNVEFFDDASKRVFMERVPGAKCEK